MNTTSIMFLTLMATNLIAGLWSWSINRKVSRENLRLSTIIHHKTHEMEHALVSARSNEAAFRNEFDLHVQTKVLLANCRNELNATEDKLIDSNSKLEDQSTKMGLLAIDLTQVTSDRDSAKERMVELQLEVDGLMNSLCEARNYNNLVLEELKSTRKAKDDLYQKVLEHKNSPANQVMEMSELEFQVWAENPDRKMEFILATDEKSAIFPMRDQTWFDKNQKYSVFRHKDGFTKTYYTTAKRFWSEK
jgi:hypothetical protein